MKQRSCFLMLLLFSIAGFAKGDADLTHWVKTEPLNSPDSINGQIHPVVKNLFYDLPLESSLKDLRKVMGKDQRFISTDSTFNENLPASFFKGITTNKGLIASTPDSIQVLLFPGNTSLATEKGGEADFKDILLVNFKYYYSDKAKVELEYERLLNLLDPVMEVSKEERSELPYNARNAKGQMFTLSKIYESYHPYYRVGISSISMIPAIDVKSVFVLDIVFSKELK